jgi:hypothetical protein
MDRRTNRPNNRPIARQKNRKTDRQMDGRTDNNRTEKFCLLSFIREVYSNLAKKMQLIPKIF